MQPATAPDGTPGGLGAAPAIVPLTASDLDGALALSTFAHWNQSAADWHMMLTLGQGWGIRGVDADGRETLVASAVALPYGEAFAWIGMVLVHGAHRRRGYATLMLRHVVDVLAARGIAAVLDATPAGHPVYVQQGFVDTWRFARYRSERRTGPQGLRSGSGSGAAVRPLRDADWAAIDALDTPAFGAPRLPLLQALAQRAPAAAHVLESAGEVRGFVFGRDGREASHIGPLLAPDPDDAIALLDAALGTAPGPVYVDLLDERRATLLPWLEGRGFALQRPFTRMVHGRTDVPGDRAPIVLVAGPELG